MAINIPIITEFSDKGLQSAQGAFGTFRSKVAEAEGGMGKFKAGAGVAMDSVKANAGKLAAVGGAAIAGFALKAIGDFKDLALAVDDFRNKTDLTLDQSSKWVSYTGDLGIEADAMTKIFSRLAKAATDEIPAFEELGVAIAFGEDGTTDIEETFLRVNDAINSLDDPVAEAAYRADLFGKGWMSAAELVQMGSDDIRVALDGVKDFEVIDEEEIEKAKDLRQAQDELADAMARLSVKLGQALIPAFTALLDAATPILELLGKIDAQAVKSAGSRGALPLLSQKIDDLGGGFLTAGSIVGEFNKLFGETEDVVDDNYLSAKELELAWKDGYRQLIIAADGAEELTDAVVDVDDALYELTDTFKAFLDEIDEEEAWNDLQDQLQKVKDKSFEAFIEGTAESAREAQDETNELIRDIAKYVDELGTVPPDVQTEIVALLQREGFDEALDIINNLRSGVTVPITGTVSGMPVPAGQTPSETTGRGTIQPDFVTERVPGLGTVRIPIVHPSMRSASVTVNVAGSVISQNDLVESVRKGLVNSQRNGAGLVYSNK